MNIIYKSVLCFKSRLLHRSLNSTAVLNIKQWREERGLPVNKTSETVLTDGPDYTYLDGRPTPLLQKQKQRMLLHQGYAQKIVELSSELDYAKQRHKDLLQAKEQERDNIKANWLKPKGRQLYKK